MAVVAVVCCNLLLGYTLIKTDAATTEVLVQVSSYADLTAKLATCTDTTKTYRIKLTANIACGTIDRNGIPLPVYCILDLNGYRLSAAMNPTVKPTISAYSGKIPSTNFVFRSNTAGSSQYSGPLHLEITDSSAAQNGELVVGSVGPPLEFVLVWAFYWTEVTISGGYIHTANPGDSFQIMEACPDNIAGGPPHDVTMTGGKVEAAGVFGTTLGTIGNANLEHYCGGELYLNGALQSYNVDFTSTTKAATCTTAGETTKTCSEHGTVHKTTIPKLGHSYTKIVVTAPTCTAQGYTTHTCSRCNDSYKDTYTAATGHTWSDWQTVTPPTTTSEGLAQRECTVCHTRETQTIPKHVHTWDDGVVTTPATCGAAGVKTYTCTDCLETYTEEIPATGEHTWDAGVVTQEPICGVAGVMTYTCTTCGATHTEEIPAITEHDWGEWKVTIEPTRDTVGSRQRECQICHTIEEQEITLILQKLTLTDNQSSYAVGDLADLTVQAYYQRSDTGAEVMYLLTADEYTLAYSDESQTLVVGDNTLEVTYQGERATMMISVPAPAPAPEKGGMSWWLIILLGSASAVCCATGVVIGLIIVRQRQQNTLGGGDTPSKPTKKPRKK